MSLHTEPFITNELFLLYSDIQLIDIYNESTLFIMTNIVLLKCKNKDKIIIFVKTEHLTHYIDYLMHFQKDYILITSCNNDFCIPYFTYPCIDNTITTHINLLHSDKLRVWYTKNPCMVHNKLKPIPIGPKWQWRSGLFFGEDITIHKNIFTKYCSEGYNAFKNKNKSKLLYFNFNCDTTNNPFIQCHKNLRNTWKTQIEKRFQWNENKQFEDYIIELSMHKFCLSPPGRGVDTHRSWEALMVGTIPIMISTPLDSLFTDLPVIIIDNLDIITEDYLNIKYEELHKKEYDFSIIYSDYWKTLFANYA